METYIATRDTAATLTRGAESSGKGGYAGRRQEDDENLVARCDTARQTRLDWETETFIPDVAGTMPAAGATEKKHGHGWGQQEWENGYCVAHALRANGFDASEDGTGRGTPIIPLFASGYEGSNGAGIGEIGDPAMTLDTSGSQAIAFHARQDPDHGPVTHPLDTDGTSIGIFANWRVRRLTPTECERLQGFPDGYTAVPYRGKDAADGPRYKALGNSMAVNCMRWIGRRIKAVDGL